MKNLSKQTNIFLISEVIMSISRMFQDTFLISYLFQLTNQDVTIISIYYIIAHLLTGLIFWIGGDVVKSKNKIRVFQLGIILNCIYILVLGLLGENCKDFYVLLGILFGISQGTYWLAAHTLRAILIPFKETKNYYSIQNVIQQIVKIAIPIVIGTSIELASFAKVAIMIFILTLIQLVCSTQLKQKIENDNSFNLLQYMGKVKKLGEKTKNIIYSYKLSFFSGINESLLITLIAIIITMAFHTSFNLGVLTTFFSIFTIVSNLLYKRYYTEKYCKFYITVCTLIPVISVISLLIDINPLTVIFYNIVNSIFITMLINIKTTQRYNCLDIEELEEYKIEHQSMYEISLAIGRIVAYTALLITGLFQDIIWFKLLLFIVALSFIPSSIILYKSQVEK